MNKRFALKLILVVVCSSLVACDYLSSFTASKSKKIEFLNNSFSVAMPSSWSLRSDLNDIANLQMGNAFKEAYAIVISENKMDFDSLSLEGHSDLTRGLIKTSLSKYKESGPEYMSNGNLRTLRYRLTGSLGGLNLVYWHVTIETKEHYHQMLLWSLKSKFSSNEADYNSVIQSFEAISG